MTSPQQWTRMGVWMPNCHNLLGLILPSPVVIHSSSRSSPAVFVNNLPAVKIMIMINTKQYVKCSKKSNVSDSRWTQPSRSLLSPRHTKCKWRWRCLSVCMFVCSFVSRLKRLVIAAGAYCVGHWFVILGPVMLAVLYLLGEMVRPPLVWPWIFW